MGQYYYPVNIDNMEYMYSHDFRTKYTRSDGITYMSGEGLKLMEHSYIGNKLMRAVEYALSPEGPWYKCRLVWAGDYADPEKGSENNIHVTADKKGKKIKPKMAKGSGLRYIVNHSKKVFIDKAKIVKDKDGFKVHPLSLLTAEGNGRGGGDFRGDDNRVGTWARDVISMENTEPEGYTEVDISF